MTTPTSDLTPPRLRVVIYHGDDSTVQLTINDDAGPMNLPATGWSAQLRESVQSDDVVGSIAIDATAAATGILHLTFPALNVGQYVWDLQCATGGIRTYVQGVVRVVRDVTR